MCIYIYIYVITFVIIVIMIIPEAISFKTCPIIPQKRLQENSAIRCNIVFGVCYCHVSLGVSSWILRLFWDLV